MLVLTSLSIGAIVALLALGIYELRHDAQRQSTARYDISDLLADLADPHQALARPAAGIKELDDAYVVIANLAGISIALKRFPKGNTPRLAQISAEHLADEINDDTYELLTN